jgi:hypothetical protein
MKRNLVFCTGYLVLLAFEKIIPDARRPEKFLKGFSVSKFN